MTFTFDPVVIVGLLTIGALYARAVRILTLRGRVIRKRQQAAWWAGWALMVIGLVSPIDSLGEDLLSAHMAQHLLIAELAAPLLLIGLRTPVLQFLLPRPVLVPLARATWLRRAFRTLRRPLVAIPVYVLVLYGWHFSFAFDGALDSPLVHALQHQTFIASAMLVWWPVIEPKRSRIPGELWKIGHLIGARLAGMFLGMFFIIMRSPAYDHYEAIGTVHGITALDDQRLAGAMMMGLDVAIMFGALCFFFWRAGAEHDRGLARAAARAT